MDKRMKRDINLILAMDRIFYGQSFERKIRNETGRIIERERIAPAEIPIRQVDLNRMESDFIEFRKYIERTISRTFGLQ